MHRWMIATFSLTIALVSACAPPANEGRYSIASLAPVATSAPVWTGITTLTPDGSNDGRLRGQEAAEHMQKFGYFIKPENIDGLSCAGSITPENIRGTRMLCHSRRVTYGDVVAIYVSRSSDNTRMKDNTEWNMSDPVGRVGTGTGSLIATRECHPLDDQEGESCYVIPKWGMSSGYYLVSKPLASPPFFLIVTVYHAGWGASELTGGESLSSRHNRAGEMATFLNTIRSVEPITRPSASR